MGSVGSLLGFERNSSFANLNDGLHRGRENQQGRLTDIGAPVKGASIAVAELTGGAAIVIAARADAFGTTVQVR